MPDEDLAADARAELWRRHDAGEIGADELEVRLQALDASTTAPAVAAALDGPVSIRRRLGSRRARRALVGAAAVVAIVAGGAGVVLAVGDDAGSGSRSDNPVIVVGGRGEKRVAIPVPARPILPLPPLVGPPTTVPGDKSGVCVEPAPPPPDGAASTTTTTAFCE